LRPQRQTTEEQGPKVPGYIVTFSDMVTLLLTFFVMLLTLADVQDPELYNKGRDAFIESIRYVGLGSLFGRKDAPYLGDLKTKYFIPDPDESADQRTLDAKAEELRRIFEKVKQSTTIVPSQIAAKRTSFSVTNVHFSPGRIDLNESARKFLTGFCRNLQQDTSPKPVELCVLCLASDAKSEKEQWLLSARRARAVADFLQETLSPAPDPQSRLSDSGRRPKWNVYSWGAGPGGDWVGPDSPISKQSQILIAVLRASD
jgi:chemotaxis protein MotB